MAPFKSYDAILGANILETFCPTSILSNTIQDDATFYVKQFIKDLCGLGTVFELYFALKRLKDYGEVNYTRNLYYEGRLCDGLRFLERYRQYEDDEEYKACLDDLRYFKSQASILSCLACGKYFVRHSSRQLYCNSWDCQAERNRRNRRASYARKKVAEAENKE
jgi:hypothetical protein